MMQLMSASSLFQSTLPAWGATTRILQDIDTDAISIHAPRMGSDLGEFDDTDDETDISIHAPAWGATSTLHLNIRVDDISIHAPAWGATWNEWFRDENLQFQSTLPHGERQPEARYRP